jgi:CBS domain containing-hemolysin-like protein
MRKFRQPMCLVRNAEGAVSGLLTTEDVLKEILGNL